MVDASTIDNNQTLLTLDSSGQIGEGVAVGFEDGLIKNGPEVNMPLAGPVKVDDRFDYSDCFYNGGHLENGKKGVDYRVHGVMGFPYQAWAKLHISGINDVVLYDKVPGSRAESSHRRERSLDDLRIRRRRRDPVRPWHEPGGRVTIFPGPSGHLSPLARARQGRSGQERPCLRGCPRGLQGADRARVAPSPVAPLRHHPPGGSDGQRADRMWPGDRWEWNCDGVGLRMVCGCRCAASPLSGP